MHDRVNRLSTSEGDRNRPIFRKIPSKRKIVLHLPKINPPSFFFSVEQAIVRARAGGRTRRLNIALCLSDRTQKGNDDRR